MFHRRNSALLVIALFGASGIAAGAEKDEPFDFALIGDTPYAPTTTTVINGVTYKIQQYPAPQYNNVIAAINAEPQVHLTLHIGDIKAGDTRCDDTVYTTNLSLFNTFARPVIFTPGDNEWTDCHRANNGGLNPIERLGFIRTTFFNTTQSLGQSKIAVARQSDDPAMAGHVPHCPGVVNPDACKFRENLMWSFGPSGAGYKILFVTINQPGSNNNHSRATGLFAADTEAEYAARNAANIAWINKAFDTMYADPEIKGLVIGSQANPFERFLEAGQGYTETGYAGFISTVRNRAKNQTKPVLLAAGDTHYFRIDRPMTQLYPECLTNATPCRADQAGPRLMNVNRTEVFAQADAHWTRVHVAPRDPELFQVRPQTVPANVLVIP